MNRGDKVRFTSDNLGVLDPETAKFVKDMAVNSGDLGIYLEPSPMPDSVGWHHITIERHGEIYVVPCHESMFEAA